MMLLSEASTALKAQLVGTDAMFTSVGADSRKIASGQLFVALKGEHFDGHDFVEQAIKQGAAAVLVSKQSSAEPAIVVQDTYQALGELAAYWRSKFNLPLAAITGSNGKTTVKEMLASILRAASKTPEAVLATQGNLNNHIGLPLTMLNLNAQHRYAVIEMGMNHTGEISYLTKLAKPTVALVNNAGIAHIGELGSVEAIAKAKGEIFEGLAADGIAVINADDDFAPHWRALIGQRKTISFGLKNTADVSASYELQADASVMNIKTPNGQFGTVLPTPGLHNVMNALAATSAALAMGIALPVIAEGLQNYVGAKGRLQHLKGVNGALVIDDTYNANPLSMKAAIDVLMAKPGEKLLVLGDMGELGDDAAALHAEIGSYAKAAGVNALLTLGTLSQEMTTAFGAGAKHYASAEALASELAARLKPTSVVLVKGSRFMAMERIVKEIITEKQTDKKEEAH
ncbi:MAG TPA: UDP-N-acetylmuramoyl-tripeptide--D-alanyl-D-alanine ligase [Methylotenera sp.]|nr:UDP-N-acetylmuramoyl-tripeptide--D-alanyl-D-alanine ligase [Methylotenera sp.]